APLGEKDAATRRAIRRALAKAGLRASGARAYDAVLESPDFAALSLLVRVDVLRAMGEGVAKSKAAPAAFAKTASEASAFRERYLLLGPAAELAKVGDGEAAKFLAAALAPTSDAHLRARAAELGGGVAALHRIVTSVVDDPEMRVRSAALAALASGGPLEKETALRALVRLETDGWTAVRLAAASAIRFAPPGDPVDARIGAAIDHEASPVVRGEMLRSLGERGARGQSAIVLERAGDDREAIDVRVAAISALGQMCDATSVPALGELALRGRAPVYEADRKLAAAAMLSLARIEPADLDQRLAPLVAADVPGDVRDLAKAALSKRGGCKPAPSRPSRP
ncbi:MAG TPA: HEAT repeat domain-containing protein, partial [Polyangiaceae bacterium]|nr:HEAT repeat domain-containing protein [Polyangiaceae bacterium]